MKPRVVVWWSVTHKIIHSRTNRGRGAIWRCYKFCQVALLAVRQILGLAKFQETTQELDISGSDCYDTLGFNFSCIKESQLNREVMLAWNMTVKMPPSILHIINPFCFDPLPDRKDPSCQR